jgi:CheY-like chemotaxis protein
LVAHLTGDPGTNGDVTRLILVVDDDQAYRSVTTRVLADAGLDTIEAGSGPEALELLEGHRVDAVLIDQVMSGMSGIELTRRLRTMPIHVMMPLLFVSGDDSPSIRVEALRAGATDFMNKRVEADELVARVQAQLGLAAQWETRIGTLRARAATISDIASMSPISNPISTAREICRRISRSNGGRGVAILSWENQPVPLAATGSPTFLEETPVVSLPARGRPGPWIH